MQPYASGRTGGCSLRRGAAARTEDFDLDELPVDVLHAAPSVYPARDARDDKVVALLAAMIFFHLHEVSDEAITRLHIAEDNVALVD